MYAVLRTVRPRVRKRHDQSVSTYPRPSLPARGRRTCRNVRCALSAGSGGGAGAGAAHNFVLAVHARELGGNVLRAVRAVIVDDDDLPRQITVYSPPRQPAGGGSWWRYRWRFEVCQMNNVGRNVPGHCSKFHGFRLSCPRGSWARLVSEIADVMVKKTMCVTLCAPGRVGSVSDAETMKTRHTATYLAQRDSRRRQCSQSCRQNSCAPQGARQSCTGRVGRAQRWCDRERACRAH